MSYLHVRRLTAVRDEYRAARTALAFLERQWGRTYEERGAEGPRFSHVLQATRSLETTYLIRLFSEMEAVLQEQMRIGYSSRRTPRTAEALINRVALLEHIPDPIRDKAHHVREYRNAIVHAGGQHGVPVSFPEALTALNRFVNLLSSS